MSLSTAIALINANVDNYPNKAFQNNVMRTILLIMCDAIAGGGGGGTVAGMYKMTSANFTSAVDCPMPYLSGVNLAILWADIPKPLDEGVDFSLYPGGGFTMLVPGFDSGTSNYTFYVFTQIN